MKKLLSLTSKDFEKGFSQSPAIPKGGILDASIRANPFITEGAMRFSAEPVEIGSGVVAGIPQNFAVSGADAYCNDASGNIYKIADFTLTGSPTVTKPKTGLTNTYGLEVFQTINSSKYLYYWQKTQIGRMLLSNGTFDDDWAAISAGYQSDVNPTLRIDDVIYFGSGSVISMIQDNGSNDTELVEAVLDLPKDFIITSLATDGDYLIISASTSISSTLNFYESRVYFWDYKNRYDSWTRSFAIQDPQIRGMETKDGVTYAVGYYGLYALAFSKEPERIREDVKGQVGYCNTSLIKDAVSFGYQTQCITYGKLKPNSPIALFKPYYFSITLTCLDTFSSNTYGLFGGYDGSTGKLYRQALFSAPSTYNNAVLGTAQIPLGDTYEIQRIDIIFNNPLSTGDEIATVQINTGTRVSVFEDVSYTINGAVDKVTTYPKRLETNYGNLIAEHIYPYFTGISGTMSIRQIDIYGERVER